MFEHCLTGNFPDCNKSAFLIWWQIMSLYLLTCNSLVDIEWVLSLWNNVCSLNCNTRINKTYIITHHILNKHTHYFWIGELKMQVNNQSVCHWFENYFCIQPWGLLCICCALWGIYRIQIVCYLYVSIQVINFQFQIKKYVTKS